MGNSGSNQGVPRPAPEPRLPGVGELVAGKYRVEAQLGVGGMGAVLSARHEQLGQIVALKLLHPSATEDADSVARFMREARAAASLESEHVVRIIDVGTSEDGAPFMVMERLVGLDLAQMLERHGTLDVALAVECAFQAALGVADAHAAGIIHRDLKPSNLFLTRKRDGVPLVKVLDFGISKALDASANVRLTQTRTIVGSPLYMSPEQVRDARRVDARSDLWSLGIILHELLSGQPAFDGDTLPGVCARIVADPPTPVTRDDVPPELLGVVERCLQKDPNYRYQSAQELSDALRPLRRDVSQSLSALGVPSLPSGTAQRTTHSHASTLTGSAPTRVSRREGELASVQAVSTPFPEATQLHPGSPGASSNGPGGVPMAQSAAALTRSSASLPASGSTRRMWLAIGASGLVAAIGALVFLQLMKAPPVDSPTPPVSASRPVEASYSFHLVTNPAGAEVFEGGTRLGQTPLALPMPVGSGTKRQLEVRLSGYRTEYVDWQPVARDSEMRVELVAEPAALSGDKPVALAAEKGQGSTVARPRPLAPYKKPVVPPKTSPTPSAKPAADLDIRMKR